MPHGGLSLTKLVFAPGDMLILRVPQTADLRRVFETIRPQLPPDVKVIALRDGTTIEVLGDEGLARHGLMKIP